MESDRIECNKCPIVELRESKFFLYLQSEVRALRCILKFTRCRVRYTAQTEHMEMEGKK